MQNEVLLIDLNGLLLTDQLRMDSEDLNQTSGLGNPHGMMEIAGTVGAISKHSWGTVTQMVKRKEIGKLSILRVFHDVDSVLGSLNGVWLIYWRNSVEFYASYSFQCVEVGTLIWQG